MKVQPLHAEAQAPTSSQGNLHQLLERPSGQPAARLLRPPASVRTIAFLLGVLLPALAIMLLAIPWQQAALGDGRVIAYAPQEREQTVEAPVGGRIQRWFVQEGSRVQEGDPLIELRDNDPELLGRLERTATLGEDQLTTLRRGVLQYEAQLDAETAARDLVVAQYAAKIAGLQRKRVGIESELEVEGAQSERLAQLVTEGVESQRKADVARLKRDKARASLEAIDNEIRAERNALGKARADGNAKIAKVSADLESARAKLSEQEQKQLDIEVKVNRQEAQLVRAPRDGVVLRLAEGPGGGQVKAGDVLLTLVPDTQSRAVELLIDGNDMPLVRDGEEARLLFEGWPALQFVGFPGADAGTYAGQVAFVDATDDGKGKFRVVVVPDPEQHEWPDAERLRQGVRAKGWILFGQVSLGYELWRQLNGFPPLPPVEKGDDLLIPTTKKPRAPSELK